MDRPMTKPLARDPMYRHRAFDAEVIEVCVRWYLSYKLSYRDLVEMMAERGVELAHTTILRWVTRYRGGRAFSDTGISGFLAGHHRDRRVEVHEEAET